jgi:hypothetical protein
VGVEAIDLVDNVHSREDGVVGGGEQLLGCPGLAPLRGPKGQGVEHDDLDLVIAGEASLAGDGFEFSIVAVRQSGQQRSGQQGAVPAASGAGPLWRRPDREVDRRHRHRRGVRTSHRPVEVDVVVPGISDDALVPARTQDAYHRFPVLHTWLGTIIGETIGYALTAVFTVLVVRAVTRASAPRWVAYLGYGAAALIATGVVIPLGLDIARLANFAGYVIWCSWLVAVAIVLWRNKLHADGGTSPPATVRHRNPAPS